MMKGRRTLEWLEWIIIKITTILALILIALEILRAHLPW
jgi:hypothetical protein